MHRLHFGTLLFIVNFVAACSNLSKSPVAAQISRGQSIYQQGCATTVCQGENGDGIRSSNGFSVWPLIGEEFQYRNPDAQVIYAVGRSGGEASLRALTNQQIYDSIAYELSLNEVHLSEPLNAQNAPYIPSGQAAEKQKLGMIYPPPGNTRFISSYPSPGMPVSAENGDLQICLTQIALASSIDDKVLPNGGNYVLVVFSLDTLTSQSLEVGPQYLRLVTKDGQMLEPQEINLDYPVARFYYQTIEIEHGTAALAIFALPGTANIDYLVYMWPGDHPLIVDLSH
jgi:hypothetical protein